MIYFSKRWISCAHHFSSLQLYILTKMDFVTCANITAVRPQFTITYCKKIQVTELNEVIWAQNLSFVWSFCLFSSFWFSYDSTLSKLDKLMPSCHMLSKLFDAWMFSNFPPIFYPKSNAMHSNFSLIVKNIGMGWQVWNMHASDACVNGMLRHALTSAKKYQ